MVFLPKMRGLFAENETFWYVRYKILYRAGGLPDGLSILVLVECVEDLPLVHPQSNVLKLTTLGQLTHLYATYSRKGTAMLQQCYSYMDYVNTIMCVIHKQMQSVSI